MDCEYLPDARKMLSAKWGVQIAGMIFGARFTVRFAIWTLKENNAIINNHIAKGWSVQIGGIIFGALSGYESRYLGKYRYTGGKTQMYKVILFDLDGTLTDSGEGITKSVQYALEKIEKPEPDLEKLRIFVGPPLMEQFQKYAGIDEETARRAVEIYRERYAPIGIYENELYPGIPEMLEGLKARGYKLGIASSKPENFVKIVADHFQISSYFDEIVGSEPDGTRTDKAQVVEEALRRMGFLNRKEQVILVGDKEHDVYGARKAGIECVAVSYGYSMKGELENAGPLKIVDSAEEILDFFA